MLAQTKTIKLTKHENAQINCGLRFDTKDDRDKRRVTFVSSFFFLSKK